MLCNHDFLKCSRPDFLFGKLRIRYSREEQCFPSKEKLLSSQIKMNVLFNNINGRKRRMDDKNMHKSIEIPVEVYQSTIKFFVTDKKNACKLEFADHLWLPFLYQP